MKSKKNGSSTVGLIILVMTLMLLTANFVIAEPRSGGAYYNYGEAMQKAILFYKAQRSGDLPADYVLPYRADSCLNDGADVGLDLTGGWYDAGDHVKFGMPMSYSAAQLAWAVYECRSALEASGQLDELLDEIKWALDYFIKCHPSANVFYYDVGSGEDDHTCWVPPEVVDLYTVRNSYVVNTSVPGSDIAGQVASAMTIGSLIFASTDATYAATLLTHARQLFTFGDTYRGLNPLSAFYPSGSYLDDLMWAAVWLYIKTGETAYLDKAKSYYTVDSLGGQYTHCWDDVRYGATMKLAQVTKDAAYAAKVEANLDFWYLPTGGINYTPGGLAYLSSWGCLRYATTAAFLAFIWADDTTVGTASKKAAYRTFAEKQVNYALGDNPKGGSYEVGFGINPPLHPHHRTTHCSWLSMLDVPAFHRHVLFGALVGGPDSNDIPNDDITDYCLNEVADDYNAGFVGSLAKMYSYYGGTPLSNWPQTADFLPAEGALTEYFVRGWIQWEGPYDCDVLFQINNRSSQPPTVRTGISARYFMDVSEVLSAGYTVSNISISVKSSDSNLSLSLSGLQQWSGNIYYFVVDLTGTSIYPGNWDICEKEVTIRITSPVTGGMTNDFSYQGLSLNPDYDCKTFNGKTELIPIYDNGVLLWGSEPGTGTVTIGPTNVPTTPPSDTAVPTAVPTTPPADTLAPTDAPTVTPAPTDTPAPTAVPTATPAGVTADPTTPPSVTADPTTPPSVTADPTTPPSVTADPTTPPAVTDVPTAPPSVTDPPATGCTCVNLCSSPTAITVPFTKDGAGEYCYTSSSLGSYINSWNADTVNVNGTTCTNTYTASSSIAAINGVYYIYYKGSVAWAHLEIK